jgi:uracil-DNA glycosylase
MSTAQVGAWSNMVLGEGPVPSLGMIIGEAPGEREVREGRPFVGPSGQLLEEALNLAGANREQFYITNVYKNRPPGNRTPTIDEAEEHQHLLEDEFSAVQPIGVLLLGAFPLLALTGQTGITKQRGQLIEANDRWYLPTFHPAYVLYNRRNPDVLEPFLGDVAEFVDRTIYLAGG